MTDIVAPTPRRPPAPVASLLLSAVAVLVALGAGLWLFARVIAPGYYSSVALGAAWFVVVGVATGRLSRRRPGLRPALRGTFVLAALLAAFGFYWTSIRDDVVDERVAVGVTTSRAPTLGAADGEGASPPGANITENSGRIESLAHSSRGTVSVVRLSDGGRVLTFTDFRTDPGPDLRVYLVAGAVNDNGDGEDAIDLGALKGNVGSQQYAIPPDIDFVRHATVVVWCRAFTVGFARAVLVPV